MFGPGALSAMNELRTREDSVADSPTRSFGRKLARRLLSPAVPVSTIELARRDVVYSCPASDACIYLVVKGLVKAVVPSRDGKECLVGIHGTGEVFGELCLVEKERTESTVAMTPVVLKRVSASTVMSSLDDDPGLREDIVRHLASRVLEQQQMISDLVTTCSEQRLAAVLLQLGRKLGTRHGELLLIGERITQEELAGMVGTTRSRIGHFLKRFRAAGLVGRPKDGFLVVHEERIVTYLDGELDLDAPKAVHDDVPRGRSARHVAVRQQRPAPVRRMPSAGRPAVARLRPAAR